MVYLRDPGGSFETKGYGVRGAPVEGIMLRCVTLSVIKALEDCNFSFSTTAQHSGLFGQSVCEQETCCRKG
jgi:hypothetical protein